jgi:hypothetical protein
MADFVILIVNVIKTISLITSLQNICSLNSQACVFKCVSESKKQGACTIKLFIDVTNSLLQ